MNDADFLKMIAEEYPDINWDNVPNPENTPLVWVVTGKSIGFHHGKEIEASFESKEYATQEEARQALGAQWKFATEPVIKAKPSNRSMNLWLYKGFLEDIKAGKKVFPLNLP